MPSHTRRQTAHAVLMCLAMTGAGTEGAGAQNDYSDRTFDHGEFLRARHQIARMKSANAPPVRTVVEVAEQPGATSGLGLRLSLVAHLRLSGSARHTECMGVYLAVQDGPSGDWAARYRHISRPYVICVDPDGRWTVAKTGHGDVGDKDGVELRHDDTTAETPDAARGPWLEAVLQRGGDVVSAAQDTPRNLAT